MSASSPRTTPKSADVVIVGAGVMGCAVAFELAKAGRRVVVVDRKSAAAEGTTSSSSAIVRGHYSTRYGVTIAYESAHTWMQWNEYVEDSDERGSARLEQVGTLLLMGPDGHHTRVTPLYDEVGVPYERLNQSQVSERLPILDMHSHWPPKRPEDPTFWDDPKEFLQGAVFTPWSGFVNDPQLATHNLQRAAERHEARFLFRHEVTEILAVRNRVSGVVVDGVETIAAPVVVNAAGPHSSRINALAGADRDMKVTTRILRHEVHHVPAPSHFDYQTDGCHVSDPDLGIDFRPETGNHISVGSEGPECDPHEWIVDPDNFNRSVTKAVWEPQVFRLARRIPTLGIPSRRIGVADLYDVTDDWSPIYDRSCVDGFYMAIGTSGNQFKNAPTVGHIMRSLIEACEGGYDHDSSPLQVQGRNLPVQMDLGAVSRLRQPNLLGNLNAMG